MKPANIFVFFIFFSIYSLFFREKRIALTSLEVLFDLNYYNTFLFGCWTGWQRNFIFGNFFLLRLFHCGYSVTKLIDVHGWWIVGGLDAGIVYMTGYIKLFFIILAIKIGYRCRATHFISEITVNALIQSKFPIKI